MATSSDQAPASSVVPSSPVSGWRFFASPEARQLARYSSILPQISALEPALTKAEDQALCKQSLSLRYRARTGEPLLQLLPEAFALVREAGRRALGMRHYDVQLLGGIGMSQRAIAEMQTGEGKTLTATLALYLGSLAGKGAHLATANDYLAKRDAEWMRPLYERLGLGVGIIQAQMSQDDRRTAYACDVTYGTAKEFGFDFLRDRLLQRHSAEGKSEMLAGMLGQPAGNRSERPVQRELHYILVDEADSLLIDEARTPLVISALPTSEQQTATEAFLWAAESQTKFAENTHFTSDPQRRSIELGAAGRRLARELPKPDSMHAIGLAAIYEYIERAIKAKREYLRDRHYVVRDGEIVIVDEFTGRLAEGRKWRGGLHQAVEAQEQVELTFETGQAARITAQDFFLRYDQLSGMTGTGSTSARELYKIYDLRVLPIPTNRPPIRKQLTTRVFGTRQAKWQAIVEEVRELHATGRPILIGTRSIDKSELLSKLLQESHIEHEILSAKQLAREAEIVARAGQRGRVTVSTNMAGRGTDIKMGPGVYELGGIHVICTELHESERIDRQLIGRCGRQGDPGTYRQYLALDDDILREGLGESKAKSLQRLGASSRSSFDRYEPLFRKAQKNIERRHFRDRKILLYQEKERQKLQTQLGQDPYLDAAG